MVLLQHVVGLLRCARGSSRVMLKQSGFARCIA
jgi:hypothetical protein